MKTKTTVRAGGFISTNHNTSFRVKTRVRAGGLVASNHSSTRAR